MQTYTTEINGHKYESSPINGFDGSYLHDELWEALGDEFLNILNKLPKVIESAGFDMDKVKSGEADTSGLDFTVMMEAFIKGRKYLSRYNLQNRDQNPIEYRVLQATSRDGKTFSNDLGHFSSAYQANYDEKFMAFIWVAGHVNNFFYLAHTGVFEEVTKIGQGSSLQPQQK